MILAVRKEEGSVPGGGFHYMLHPMEITPQERPIWELMRYVVFEVEEEKGKRLLDGARKALANQMEVALATELALKKLPPLT